MLAKQYALWYTANNESGGSPHTGGDACIRPYNNNHLQQQESYL